MNPRLNAIQNYSSFFYPLPNKLFFILLPVTESEDRRRVVGGELSDTRSVTAHCCVILPGITKLKSCIRSTYFQSRNKLKLPIFYKTSSHKLKAFIIVWNRNVTFILTIKPILGFHQSCDQN